MATLPYIYIYIYIYIHIYTYIWVYLESLPLGVQSTKLEEEVVDSRFLLATHGFYQRQLGGGFSARPLRLLCLGRRALNVAGELLGFL